MEPESKVQQWLGDLLALLRAQHWIYWSSHWEIWGDDFYGNHLLFERMYSGDLTTEIDTLAEKMVCYFGAEAVNPIKQFTRTAQFIAVWGRIDCPMQRALRMESDCQKALQLAYDAIKESGEMTLGLDDFIMATANRHETALYLFRQKLHNKVQRDEAMGKTAATLSGPEKNVLVRATEWTIAAYKEAARLKGSQSASEAIQSGVAIIPSDIGARASDVRSLVDKGLLKRLSARESGEFTFMVTSKGISLAKKLSTAGSRPVAY